METVSGRVKLVEQALGNYLELDFVDGQMVQNFRKLLDHMYPGFVCSSPHDNNDALFSDAIEAVRRATLTVDIFVKRSCLQDLSSQDMLEFTKEKKRNASLTLEEYLEKPTNLRIWESRVKRQCESIRDEKYKRVKAVLRELDYLHDKFGEDKEELQTSKEEYMEELEEWESGEKDQLEFLRLEMQASGEGIDREQLAQKVFAKTCEIAEGKARKMKEWYDTVSRIKDLERSLETGVDGNTSLTEDQYDAFTNQMESFTLSILDQISFLVNAPYKAGHHEEAADRKPGVPTSA